MSAILCLFLLVVSGFYFYQKHVNNGLQKNLYNKIAKLEGLVKETEDGWSEKGVELENLKTQNRDLQSIISARNEDIVSLNNVALRWKKKFFKVKNTKQTVVASDGVTIVEIPPDCRACLDGIRLRVEFEQIKDYLKVSGHTLTNPSYAEINLEWVKDVKFTLILAKDKNKKYRIYLDSADSDIIPSRLELKIDPSVFDKKWYEKIAVSSQLMAGSNGLFGSFGLTYDFTDNLYAGPGLSAIYVGNKMYTFYGFSGGWYIFR